MIEIKTTCRNLKESEKISKLLLNKKLAACINYFPITSNYLWNNKTEKTSEYLLIIKTAIKKEKEAVLTIRKNHSYKLPVITISKFKTSKDAEKWINETVTNT